jgi:hypothetical protein
MAYAPSTVAPRDFAATKTPARTRRGFFSRLFDAMMHARQRQAEREIAYYLRGTKFTDEAEREIERRFFSSPRT